MHHIANCLVVDQGDCQAIIDFELPFLASSWITVLTDWLNISKTYETVSTVTTIQWCAIIVDGITYNAFIKSTLTINNKLGNIASSIEW